MTLTLILPLFPSDRLSSITVRPEVNRQMKFGQCHTLPQHSLSHYLWIHGCLGFQPLHDILHTAWCRLLAEASWKQHRMKMKLSLGSECASALSCLDSENLVKPTCNGNNLNYLIFLPLRPSFRCQRPLLGAIPEKENDYVTSSHQTENFSLVVNFEDRYQGSAGTISAQSFLIKKYPPPSN